MMLQKLLRCGTQQESRSGNSGHALGMTRGGAWARAVVVLLTLTVFLLWGVKSLPAAVAEAGADAPVTWSVSPADAAGPNGKSWVELELDPGATADSHLAVRNLGDHEVTFGITAADGYFTDTGRFNMLPSDAKSVAAGTWISVQKQVKVAAGKTAVVPFTVAVPQNATPGDHAAGIAASIQSVGGGDGNQLNVESRVGFRVMTRVKGVINPKLEVSSMGSYDLSWNPFSPGLGTLEVVLENKGNVRLRVGAAAENGAQDGPVDRNGETPKIELLPGDKRTISIGVPDLWPLGAINVPVTVSQEVVAINGSLETLAPIVHDVSVWAVPWPQTIIVLALLLMAFGALWGNRRRRKQVRQLVEQARELGRSEAQGERETV